jgi:16S rRNA (adenine1518-N6/adenine1519-N6)-dimethyltransferase
MMNLTRLSEVHALIRTIGIHPNRTLGQNFLVDRNILEIILDAAGLSREDTVLEIGPGLGTLTVELAERAGRVIAVEKDRGLFEHLAVFLKDRTNVTLMHGDALDVVVRDRIAALPPYDKLVANLPYSVGTRIVLDASLQATRPACMVVTVQREVADRMTAVPASRDYGMLTLWLALHYEATCVKTVSASCFWPRPDVQSAVVRLVRRTRLLLSPESEPVFRHLTKHAFSQRRKQLATSLRTVSGVPRLGSERLLRLLNEAGCDPRTRPGELPLEGWLRVADRWQEALGRTGRP